MITGGASLSLRWRKAGSLCLAKLEVLLQCWRSQQRLPLRPHSMDDVSEDDWSPEPHLDGCSVAHHDSAMGVALRTITLQWWWPCLPLPWRVFSEHAIAMPRCDQMQQVVGCCLTIPPGVPLP